MLKRRVWLTWLTRLLALSVCGGAGAVNSALEVFDYRVIERRAFDAQHFTQGLLIEDEALWVSSGLYGRSYVARYTWPDLVPVKRVALPKHLFAEGLALLQGKLYVLTWRSQRMLVLNPDTLMEEATFELPSEGWGLTSDGERLWLSDGTPTLSVWRDGAVQRQLKVTLNGQPVSRLNELEWINGEIWANVWLTNQIVRIDPTSGQITSIIDLTGLLPSRDRSRQTDVLNGIAVDPANKAVWVTGKRWPYLYRIELVNRAEN